MAGHLRDLDQGFLVVFESFGVVGEEFGAELFELGDIGFGVERSVIHDEVGFGLLNEFVVGLGTVDDVFDILEHHGEIAGGGFADESGVEGTQGDEFGGAGAEADDAPCDEGAFFAPDGVGLGFASGDCRKEGEGGGCGDEPFEHGSILSEAADGSGGMAEVAGQFSNGGGLSQALSLCLTASAESLLFGFKKTMQRVGVWCLRCLAR